MQYDRDQAGESAASATGLPASIQVRDSRRLAAVLQDVDSVFHTDGFRPLLERVGELVGPVV